MIATLTYTARMHRSPVPLKEMAASWRNVEVGRKTHVGAIVDEFDSRSQL